ncbi:uncharacterized protein HD556DRAFT_1309421 [Suillus plorans]|uniref:Uncharacterized protein n=1 Tax=Suillus plorans TaxID=116603 RepID=A0A9P7ANX8_9AGAM|nr:uncharacterized protein HD556DRAFT_1309421 [Suillus plorans]KAG1792357.1 hypothetical protein HD556DRAFT_1309421 [Suillus plorans]
MSVLSPPSPGFLASSLSLSDHSTNFLQHPKDYPQHNNQLQEQIAVYESQCIKLQCEITRLTGERDTIKQSYHAIIQVLGLLKDTDPLKFSIDNIMAMVSHIKRGTAPYLEEEDGNHTMNTTLKSIRQMCRTAWAELVVKKLAPLTWARLCASAEVPPQSGQDLEEPRQTAAKREAMDEDEDDMHFDTKPIVHNVKKSKGKKHKCSMDASNASELTNKRQKVTLVPKHCPGSLINISDSGASLSSSDHSLPATPIDTTSIVIHSSTHTRNTDLPSPLSNHDCNHDLLEGLGNSPDKQHEPDLPLPTLPPSSPPCHGAFLPGISLDDSNNENVSVVLKNSLAIYLVGTVAFPKSSPLQHFLQALEQRFYEEWKTNKNGTTDEFKLYWTTLSTAQQDEYQAEAERLDSTGAWKKASDPAVINGTPY